MKLSNPPCKTREFFIRGVGYIGNGTACTTVSYTYTGYGIVNFDRWFTASPDPGGFPRRRDCGLVSARSRLIINCEAGPGRAALQFALPAASHLRDRAWEPTDPHHRAEEAHRIARTHRTADGQAAGFHTRCVLLANCPPVLSQVQYAETGTASIDASATRSISALVCTHGTFATFASEPLPS